MKKYGMKRAIGVLVAAAGLAVPAALGAGEEGTVELGAGGEAAPRWHVSVGARFAPGVKTSAGISSGAAIEAAGGRLGGAGGTRVGAALPTGGETSTERKSETASTETGESVAVEAGGRYEFEHGFIDMADDAGIEGETCNWHFDGSVSFDESGAFVSASEPVSETTRESTTVRSAGETVSSVSSRSSFSETVEPDVCGSREDDLWGADLEIGYDLIRGERFALEIGLGTAWYQGVDAIRAAGRCYEASASSTRETASGRYVTTTTTTTDTTTTTRETTKFSDSNFAYDGALDDLRNDDGSFGAGTPDGYSNPYGGNNPVLTVSDVSIEKTTSVETRKDTTVETSRVFEPLGTSTRRSGTRRTIDVRATGDVQTEELRLVLRPAWQAARWLELRGAAGAVATRVDVETDAVLFVDGAQAAKVSGDDGGWVVCGLCGLDVVLRPVEWLEVAVGGDLRIGDTDWDYKAGLVRGSVELARYTVWAGVGVRS